MQKGSPPRGRGKEAGCGPQKSRARITPAWAGKRRQPSGPCAAPRDHPRVGGEKPAGGQHRAPKRGTTPPWAGKRAALVWVCAKPWDHPRVGGEKTKLILLFRLRLGSPPRWRGKAEAFVRKIAAGGITPALAGKRLKRSHRSGIFISGPIPFHSVLHRPAGSGGSRAGRDGSPAGQPQNAGPA